MASFKERKISEIEVPIVYNAKNKILYFVTLNDYTNSAAHTNITINNHPAERLRKSYGNNPFAHHHNSRLG